MDEAVGRGVDGIITDYPDRLRTVARLARFQSCRAGYTSPFDIQGHRGAPVPCGPENTLAAFEYALANPAISTLELDTGVTKDGHLVVIHDRTINGTHCPLRAFFFFFFFFYQYVGRPSARADPRPDQDDRLRFPPTLPEFPAQVAVPGARIPTLDKVFNLVKTPAGGGRCHGEHRDEDQPAGERHRAVRRLHQEAGARRSRSHGMTRRATIQSFDWRTIMLAHKPQLQDRDCRAGVAVRSGPECGVAGRRVLAPGRPTATVRVKSPWTGGLDWWRLERPGHAGRQVGCLDRLERTGRCTTRRSGDGRLVRLVPSRRNPAYFHGPCLDQRSQAQGDPVHDQQRDRSSSA